MVRPPWFERLEAELKRRGVPARFRRRFLAEAHDHADDLAAEGFEMTENAIETRLGEPESVAAGAAEEYRKASWTRRHPILVFGLLPIPLWLFAVAFVICGFLGVSSALTIFFPNDQGELNRSVQVPWIYGMCYSIRFVPFIALAAFFTRRYLKSGVHWAWYGLAIGQTLLPAATFFTAIWYDDEVGKSQFTAGFLLLGDFFSSLSALWLHSGWAQIIQLSIPIAFGWSMIRLAKRRQSRLQMA